MQNLADDPPRFRVIDRKFLSNKIVMLQVFGRKYSCK